jgi:hypothetical protein
VLTARHCVTTDGDITTPLRGPNEIFISATWAPGVWVVPTRIRELNVNVPTPQPESDLALLYLGNGDFGAVNSQSIYASRLKASDTATQYGRGLSAFATGSFHNNTQQPSAGSGTYRSAQFVPSQISATGYKFAPNAQGQITIGGDSGGPTVVTANGANAGIAGVASWCSSISYIPGTPLIQQKGWTWANGIGTCHFASTERFVAEIANAIQETPPIPTWLPAILDFILD